MQSETFELIGRYAPCVIKVASLPYKTHLVKKHKNHKKHKKDLVKSEKAYKA